jgi:pimeloyl-ACP methyl ester carboxylesterase
MEAMSYNGHDLRFVDRGSGEAIVFVHNAAVGHRLWDRQLDHFARTHRVVAPDLLGIGDSDRPQMMYTAEGYVHQLERLVDHLDLAGFHLVGCCLGGSVALEYARRHPRRVLTLTAVTAPTPATIAAGPFGPFERLSRPGTRRRDLIAWWCETRVGKAVMTFVFRRYQCGPKVLEDAEFSEYVTRLYRSDGQWRVFCNTSYDSFAALDRFKKPAGFPPTLMMWGGRNPLLPASAGRELARVVAPDRVEWWKDCGYMLMRERPAETNRVLAEHFAAARERAPAPARELERASRR